jgi:hypothetical protein
MDRKGREGGDMRGGDMAGHMGGMGFGFGGLLCLLALGALVFLLVKKGVFRGLRGGCPMCAMKAHNHGAPGEAAADASVPQDALRVLDERLAKGEVEVKDYMERKAALLGDRGIQDPPKFD